LQAKFTKRDMSKMKLNVQEGKLDRRLTVTDTPGAKLYVMLIDNTESPHYQASKVRDFLISPVVVAHCKHF
jgi:hypothetical protein